MEKKIQYTATRVVMDPARAPRQVHRFLYTRVGAEILLEVGYHDVAELKVFVDKVKENPDNVEAAGELPLYVTDRFVLSKAAAEDFIKTAEFMREDLEQLKTRKRALKEQGTAV